MRKAYPLGLLVLWRWTRRIHAVRRSPAEVTNSVRVSVSQDSTGAHGAPEGAFGKWQTQSSSATLLRMPLLRAAFPLPSVAVHSCVTSAHVVRGRRATLSGWLLCAAAAVATACATPQQPAPSSGAAGTSVQKEEPTTAATDLAAMLTGSELVDLTHTFDERTLVWPTSNPFRLEKVFDGITPGGYYYAANNVHTAEHGGTHLDAPIHFAAGHQTADQVPLSRLIGPAIIVDVTGHANRDADYLVTVEDLTQWEDANGAIERGSLVLLRTGFSTRWPDAARYLGTAARGPAAVAHLHFPGLHPNAAMWLVKEREIAAAGIDTASIDRGQSTGFETHRVLAAANVPAFENLTRLEALPARGAVVFALPMKVGGGSGAPLRAVAMVRR